MDRNYGVVFLCSIIKPEILRTNGWKIYFYSNEGSEQPHVHCKKAEKKGKFFLLRTEREIVHDRSFKMKGKEINEVTEVLKENYDFILEMWNNYFS